LFVAHTHHETKDF